MRMKAKIFCLITVFFVQYARGQQVLYEKIFVHTDRSYYQTGEIIWFSLYCVEGSKFTPLDISKIAYVEVLDSANKPVLQGKVLLENGAGNGSFTIPLNAPTSTYTLRAYTNWMKNFTAEGYFNKEIAIVNAAAGQLSYISNSKTLPGKSGSLSIDIKPNNTSYQTRKKVSVAIDTKNSSGSSHSSALSISVYRLDSLTSPDESSIFISLHDDTINNIPQNFPYPPEYKGHFVMGKMLDRNTRMPSKNVVGYLSVMDDVNSFYTSKTDAAGNLTFLVSKLNSADSIVVQTHSYYDREHQIEIESPFSTNFASPKPSSFSSVSTFSSTMLEQSINAQATALYYEEQLNKFNEIRKDTTPFYYKEDVHYPLDDYTRFSKMEDVFREYIRPVAVTKRQGVFHLSVFNETNRFIVDQNPLVLLDGIPVFDMNAFFAYDPLKVKTIDVVTTKYFRSGAAFPGIVSLYTYRGKTDRQVIDENANVLPYEIVQKLHPFFAPSYEQPGNTHLPDFRNVLYWNPSVQTNAQGKATLAFYTSDLAGEYVIQVNGITKSGEAGSGAVKFEVTN